MILAFCRITLVALICSTSFVFAMKEEAKGKTELKELDPCDFVLSGSSEQVAHAFFANFSANHQDGLGVRGFMGAALPNTPSNIQIAMEYGLIWWGMKWNFASSVEEAIAHRLKARALHEAKGTPYTDVIVAGQYFLGTEDELGLAFEDNVIERDVPPEKVRELIARGAYQVDETGKAVFISPEQLARRMSLNGMKYHKSGDLPGAFGKNSLTQAGWVAFKQHGIHDYSIWKGSSEAKKLRKLARNLADRGYTIRFNTDYQAMLDKIKGQKRSYRDQSIGEDGVLVKGRRMDLGENRSRYSSESVYKSALNLLQAGQGYSVGVYDGRGTLVAGEIGFRSGNHLYGDSVFYDEIEHAKIAALALFDVLDAAGMPYSDPGMITPYTASMGAELIPFAEYLRKIKGGPADFIQLPSSWDPRGTSDLDATFAELARKKSQGLGHMKFIRRVPTASGEEVVAAAARAGLERAHLNLVFVESAEEAAAHVLSVPWGEMPIYIQGNLTHASAFLSTLDFLRAALAAGPVQAYFIPSARHPEMRRDVPLNQLRDVLDLNVAVDAPTWSHAGGSLPSLSVNGWGIKPSPRP